MSFSDLFQWAKATLEKNAKIVKEPKIHSFKIHSLKIRFFDNFCKKSSYFLQCGFNPLSFSDLFQWAKATLEKNAKIVKEPKIHSLNIQNSFTHSLSIYPAKAVKAEYRHAANGKYFHAAIDAGYIAESRT